IQSDPTQSLLDDVRDKLHAGRIFTSASAGGFALGYAPQGASVLIRYVYAGDANLDGIVNALDFNAIAANFGGASGLLWTEGDLNYDGTVNTLDFDALALNFNKSLPASLGTFLPEPAVAIFFTAMSMITLRSRRRSGRLLTSRKRNSTCIPSP